MEYTYEEIAKAKAIADEKIDDILKPIFKQFDFETKRIVNMFDKVCYEFNNEEEKAKLLEKFEKVEKEKNKSEYSKYIKIEYEIDGRFFFVDSHIARGRFAEEQRRKAMQNIVIEL
jgi:hypothetical protein